MSCRININDESNERVGAFELETFQSAYNTENEGKFRNVPNGVTYNQLSQPMNEGFGRYQVYRGGGLADRYVSLVLVLARGGRARM